MNISPDSPPSPKDQLALHQRLVEGDATATADLADAFLNPLIDYLVEKNRRLPPEFCAEAAEDALIALSKNPLSFDPARGKPFWAYLKMSAQGDLRNLIQRENRHHQRRQSLESVEQSPQAWKYLGTDEDPSRRLEIEEELETAKDQILPVIGADLAEAQLRVLNLMFKGERKTSVFAQAYGISHLPRKEQEKVIKRVKDMLKKRIRRARLGHEQPS